MVPSELGAETWHDLDCGVLVPSVINDTAITTPDDYTTFFHYLNDCYSPFLGHPLCRDSSPACSFRGTCGRADLGPASWPPEEFASAMDEMSSLHAKFPVLLERGWNEIFLFFVVPPKSSPSYLT